MIFPISKVKYEMMKEVYLQKKIHLSALFKKINVSPKIGYRYLQELLSAKVLQEQLEGKKPTLRYLLPQFSMAGILCFALVEEEKKLLFFAEHKELIGPLQQFSREIGKNATILIFGSFARGSETKESDIDIMLLAKKIDKKKVELISEECFVTVRHRPSIRILPESKFIKSLQGKDALALQIENNHIIISGALCWVELVGKSQHL
ncbi:MAG: nucleotidyltransferase domain-containing protein [Nanoarchaeota archaeon]|nr:nucleotidyltransferase domain-containing protein [Nanoarchaeota archaeon]